MNFALGAAHEALTDAKLEFGTGYHDCIGCVIGSGLPGAELWHRVLHGAYAEGRAQQIAGHSAVAIAGNCSTGILSARLRLRAVSASF